MTSTGRLVSALALIFLCVPGLVRAADPEEISVALYRDYLPLSGLNLAGEPSGVLPDIWRLWSKKTGVRVKFSITTFPQSLDLVKSGRVDVHGGLFRNAERSKWLVFSRSLQESTTGLYYWRGHGDLPTMENLKGRAVGTQARTYQEDFLRREHPDLRVRSFEDLTDMLRTLARGEIAVAVYEDLAMDNILRRAGVQGEVGRLPIELLRNSIHAGVAKNRKDISELVDWGLSRISRSEFAAIEERWIADPAARFFDKPKGETIPFTQEQKRWLTQTNTVRVGMMNAWPPMSATDPDGKAEGMSPAFVKLLNKRLGDILHIVPGPWKKIYADVKGKQLDLILDITPLKRRQGDFNFTQPYLIIPHAIVGRTDDGPFKGFRDLKGKTIAVERGFGTVRYLKTNFPEIKVNEFGSTLESLQAVARGEADAYAGNSAVAKYLIGLEENGLAGLAVHGDLADRQSKLAIGVRKDWPILRDILDKALRGISPRQVDKITKPWLGNDRSRNFELTVREQRWLARNHDEKVRVMVGTWPPFHYVHEDQDKGLALAYVRHALDVLGLEVEPVRLLWHEALAGISKFEKVDLLPTIARSPEREKLVAMTRDYLSFPLVIFVRKDGNVTTGLEDLTGKIVAVERNFIMHRRLAKDHPDIKLLPVEKTHLAIEAVSLGKADAYVGNLAAGSFHIEKHGFANIKVAAPTSYKDDSQAMGVRRDWPELASMIDKVLVSMGEKDHASLRNDALSIRFDHGLDIERVIVFAVPILAVVFVVIVVFVGWNRQLTRQIEERRKIEAAMKDREEWFKSLLESAPDATVIVDPEGNIVRVNRQAEIVFGTMRDNLLGQPFEFLVPECAMPNLRVYGGSTGSISEPVFLGDDRNLLARKFDGSEFPVEISLSPIETADGTLIAASMRDVTERRAADAELAEKDLQLTASLENMSGGMFMVDKDLIIRVFNSKFVELYKLPEVKIGMPLKDILTIRAARGDYGDGDVGELVTARLEGYKNEPTLRVEDRIPPNLILEGFRQPTGDGGVVFVCNDITVRKKAEEALAAQTRQLQRLSDKLARYLSPQIYESIFAGASDASVQTERKKLTVFFSDIKNFTATTEEMEPEDMTYLLNDYLTKMTEVALEYGGTIDKYIGDAIMVFFGDPDTKGVKEDALAAVRMAIAMQRRMVDLRAKWADMGFRFPFHIRCGVNTGYCNVGNFGSDQRIDYTIIGGQVNLAARLESICEPDGVTIAYETYTHVRDEIDADPLEPIQVKGIKDPVKPFAVQNVFDDWEADERYIRRDIRGMRLWVDLMRMSEEQRMASIKELEEALDILKVKRIEDAADG